MTEYRSQRLQQRLRALDTTGTDNVATNIPSRPVSTSSSTAASRHRSTVTPPANSTKNHGGGGSETNEIFFDSDEDIDVDEGEEEEEENVSRSGTGRDRNALKRRREQVREASRRFRERKKGEITDLQNQVDELTKQLNRYKSSAGSSSSSASGSSSSSAATNNNNDNPLTPTGSFRSKEVSALRSQVTTLTKEIDTLNGILNTYQQQQQQNGGKSIPPPSNSGDNTKEIQSPSYATRSSKYAKLSVTNDLPSGIINDPLPSLTTDSTLPSKVTDNPPAIVPSTSTASAYEGPYRELYQEYTVLYQRIKEYEEKYMEPLQSKLTTLSTLLLPASSSSSSSTTPSESESGSTSGNTLTILPRSSGPNTAPTDKVIEVFQSIKELVEDYAQHRITQELTMMQHSLTTSNRADNRASSSGTIISPSLPHPTVSSSFSTLAGTPRSRTPRQGPRIQELSKGDTTTRTDRLSSLSTTVVPLASIDPSSTNPPITSTGTPTPTLPQPIIPFVYPPPENLYPPYIFPSSLVPLPEMMDTTAECVDTSYHTLYRSMLDICSFSNEPSWKFAVPLSNLFSASTRIHNRPTDVRDYKIYYRPEELPIVSYKVEILIQRIEPPYLSHSAWLYYTQSHDTNGSTGSSNIIPPLSPSTTGPHNLHTYIEMIHPIPTSAPVSTVSTSNAAIVYRQDSRAVLPTATKSKPKTKSMLPFPTYVPVRDFVYGIQTWDHAPMKEVEKFLDNSGGQTTIPPLSSFDNYSPPVTKTDKDNVSTDAPVTDDTLYIGVLRSVDHPYHPVIADIPRMDLYGGWIIKSISPSIGTMASGGSATNTLNEPLSVLTLIGQINFGATTTNVTMKDTVAQALQDAVIAADTIVNTAQILKENESEGMVSTVSGFQPPLVPVYPASDGYTIGYPPPEYVSTGYYPVPVELNDTMTVPHEGTTMNDNEERSSYVFPTSSGGMYYPYYPTPLYNSDGTVYPPYVPSSSYPVTMPDEGIPVPQRITENVSRSYTPSIQRKGSYGSMPSGADSSSSSNRGKSPSEATVSGSLASSSIHPPVLPVKSNPQGNVSEGYGNLTKDLSSSYSLMTDPSPSDSLPVSRRSSVSTVTVTDPDMVRYPFTSEGKDTTVSGSSVTVISNDDDGRSGSVGLDALLNATDKDYREHRSLHDNQQRNAMDTT